MRARTIIKTPNVMGWVLVALLPGLAGMTYYFGLGILWNLFFLSALCLVTEFAVIALRNGSLASNLLKTPLKNCLGDGTTLLAAWLIAICLPPFGLLELALWCFLIAKDDAIAIAVVRCRCRCRCCRVVVV